MSSRPKGPAIGSSLELEIPQDARVDLSGRVQVKSAATGSPLAAQAINEDIDVEGMWPGEAGRLRVLARSRHHARIFARALSRSQDHPQRQPAPCAHHPDRVAKEDPASKNNGKTRACGGCPWMTLDIEAQRALKVQHLQHFFAHPIETMQGPPPPALGYRHVAKRVAGLHRGQVVLGSYQPQSHRVASMHLCQVDLPLIQELFARCQDLIRKHRVRVYEEQKKSGELRYLWAKSDGTHVHLTLLCAQPRSPQLQALIDDLAQIFAPKLTLSWALHDRDGNVLRPDCVPETLIAGDRLPTLEVLGQKVELDALSFIQANPDVAQQCYQALLSDESGQPLQGEVALDLYAGAGATSAALAKRYKKVMACEQSPPPGADPRVLAARAEDFLRDFGQTFSQTFSQTVGQALGQNPHSASSSSPKVQLVIANPPRAGMRPQVCDALGELRPDRIHIMSCGPAGLQRNIEALVERGYQLSSLLAFDPLPHTAHVELVARLRRKSPAAAHRPSSTAKPPKNPPIPR